MHCLPVVHIARPDTVKLSGSTTLKVMRAVYNWTISGFDICPRDTQNIRSPVFSHPNSSKWCVELEKDDGSPRLCFHLVASSDVNPVGATLKASVSDRDGAKHCVYPPDFYKLETGERSTWDYVMDSFDPVRLGNNWTFECEVCTVEVVSEDTSDASEEDVQSAVAKDLEHLLDSKDVADITLIAGRIQLKAHRAILCARSPVFRAMLSYDTKEARDGQVEIPDLEPEVVSEMLRYMYTDRVQIPSDTTEKLLVASDKYGLGDAKLKCEAELVRQLTVDSAATIAVNAIVHSCSLLQKVCVDFIKQNLEQVVGTRGWADVIDKHPKAIKRISELVTEESERCASPSATSGSQSDATTTDSPTIESVSDCRNPATCSGSSDTTSDSGYTCCEKKKVIYVWTVSGLSNWPHETDFVASPHFCHPETIQWEVRLYKRATEYEVRFQLLENKAGESVVADLSVSVIPPEGEKCRIHTSTSCMFQEGVESGEGFECGYLVDDVLMLECEISTVCVMQQCIGMIKPVLQSSLGQDLESLLQSRNFADFKLCAGAVEFEAHRAILAARSPFFARMLQPGTEVFQKGQLEVSGVAPGVMVEILHYVYTGRVKNMGDSTGELLAAAQRFELCGLKRECITYMLKRLTVGNAVNTAVYSIESQCDTLLNMCMTFIRSHFKQVMGTAEWFEAIDRHPAAIKRICQLVAEPGK